MFAAPIDKLINMRVNEFLGHLPGVRNGDVTSIHDARVATRRLRELVPLVGGEHAPHIDDLADGLRVAGRRLGRVRELDVMFETLAREERVSPVVATVTAPAAADLTEQRTRAVRALIKQLERLKLEDIAAGLLQPRPRRQIDAQLRRRIGTHAAAVRATATHATGVYFPNRSHELRIAIKKLRYAVEVATELRLWRPPHLLKDLRELQSTLGGIRDNQVLMDWVEGHSDGQVSLLTRSLRVDIDRLHQQYLTQRDRIPAIADACGRFANRGKRGLLPRRLLLRSKAQR